MTFIDSGDDCCCGGFRERLDDRDMALAMGTLPGDEKNPDPCRDDEGLDGADPADPDNDDRCLRNAIRCVEGDVCIRSLGGICEGI